MKAIMAILISMVMAITLAPWACAATSVQSGNMPEVVFRTNSGAAGLNAAVATGAVSDAAGADYSCVSSPAYTSYVQVRPQSCPASGRPLQTPWVMGGWQ